MDTTSDHNSSDREKRLEEILAAYLDAVDAGETPDRNAWLAHYTEFADDLRGFFAAQDQFAPLRPRRDAAPCRIRYVGDYELLEELGRGGMGVVYKARQVSLNRTVAVKLIRDSRLVSATDVQRFHIEAEAAANLQHPGIVAVYEVGEHAGQHYFSMAYIEGRTLAALIREGPLPATDAARYVRQVAQAIHYAHQQGTLHRDIKPSNILIDLEDQPHITDFGLAKRVSADSDLTATGAVVGTPGYMSPEQALSQQEDLGPAIDVYSLGATLYAAITGRPPFQAANVVDTLQQVILTPPVSPRALNPAIPRDLETICLKCLEKDRGKRYATAAELGEDLQRWLKGEPIRARPVGAIGRLWRWMKRQPVIAALVAAVMFSLFAGTVVSSYFAVEERKRAGEAAKSAAQAQTSARRAAENAQEAALAARRELEQRKEADKRSHLANALRLAAQSEQLAKDYPQRSVLLALEALKATLDFGEPRLVAAEQALRNALRSIGGRPLPSSGAAMATSRDGRWLVTKGSQGTAWLWDLTGENLPGSRIAIGGHKGEVDHVVISMDSRWLVTGSRDDETLRLWDLKAKSLAAAPVLLQGRKRPIRDLVISPDSHWLVARNDEGRARLWDLCAKDRALSSIEIHSKDASVYRQMVVSPNSQWLIALGNGKVWRWKLTDQAPLAAVEIGDKVDTGGRLLITPDSRWLLAGGDRNTLWRWDLVAKDPAAERAKLAIPDHLPSMPKVSPDGRWLVCEAREGKWERRTVTLFDLTSKATVVPPLLLQGDDNRITDVGMPGTHCELISADGRWLCAYDGKDGGVRLWDLTVRDPNTRTVKLGGEETWGPATFSPDSRWLITGSRDGSVRLWDLSEGNPRTHAVLLPKTRRLSAAAFPFAVSSNSRWLVTGSDETNTAWLWDLTAKSPATTGIVLRGNEDAVFLLDSKSPTQFSLDSRWLVTSNAFQTSTPSNDRLWDLANLQHVAAATVLRGHAQQVHSAAISSDSHWLVTCSDDGTLRRWDLTSKNPAALPLVFRKESPFRSFVATPDFHWLVTINGDGAVQRWDMAAPSPAATAVVLSEGNEALDFQMAISADSRWLVARGRGQKTAQLWDLAAKTPFVKGVLCGEDQGGLPVFTPDSRWLAHIREDRTTVHVWDLSARDPAAAVVELRNWASGNWPLVISQDGRWMATGSHADTVRVSRFPPSGPDSRPQVLEGDENRVNHIAISPDGRWLACGSFGGTLTLWGMTREDGSPRSIEHRTVEGVIHGMRISPDSRWLVVDTRLGVRLWDLRSTSPAETQLTLTGRALWSWDPWRRDAGRTAQPFLTFKDHSVISWDLSAENPAATGITICGEEEASEFRTLSADGRWLVTADKQGTVYLWTTQLGELMDSARMAAGRDLTDEERVQYLLEPRRQAKSVATAKKKLIVKKGTNAAVKAAEREHSQATDLDKELSLRKSLDETLAALAKRDIKAAQNILKAARAHASGPNDHDLLTRYENLADYVREFWNVMRDRVSKFRPLEEVELGKTRIIVVEAGGGRFTIRTAGKSLRYDVVSIPSWMAIALADTMMAKDPQTQVVYGAFLAVDPDGDREQAKRMWAEAARRGVKIEQLLPSIDSFDSFPPVGASGREPKSKQITDLNRESPLRKSLDDFIAALAKRDIEAAQNILKAARAHAKTPDDHDLLTRYENFADYVREFWRGMRERVSRFQPLEEVELGKTRVIVVEAGGGKFAIRAAGKLLRYDVVSMPSWMAIALADAMLAKDPQTQVVYGAFLAVDPDGDREQAKRMWAEAARRGVKLDQLLPSIDSLPPLGASGTESKAK